MAGTGGLWIDGRTRRPSPPAKGWWLQAKGFLLPPKACLLQANPFLLQRKGFLLQGKGFSLLPKGFLLQRKTVLLPAKSFLLQRKPFLLQRKGFLLQRKHFCFNGSACCSSGSAFCFNGIPFPLLPSGFFPQATRVLLQARIEGASLAFHPAGLQARRWYVFHSPALAAGRHAPAAGNVPGLATTACHGLPAAGEGPACRNAANRLSIWHSQPPANGFPACQHVE